MMQEPVHASAQLERPRQTKKVVHVASRYPEFQSGAVLAHCAGSHSIAFKNGNLSGAHRLGTHGLGIGQHQSEPKTLPMAHQKPKTADSQIWDSQICR